MRVCLSSFATLYAALPMCVILWDCAATLAMMADQPLWQVIPKRHPRQPMQTGPSWPALVHKGFLAAWTAGGFRCCFNPPSASECSPTYQYVTLPVPTLNVDGVMRPTRHAGFRNALASRCQCGPAESACWRHCAACWIVMAKARRRAS